MHDPEDFPLPNIRLLEIQWVLHRLMAIRGASEEFSEDDYEDDDADFRLPSWFQFRPKEDYSDYEGEDEEDEGEEAEGDRL
jgi:hypothetical protein